MYELEYLSRSTLLNAIKMEIEIIVKCASRKVLDESIKLI